MLFVSDERGWPLRSGYRRRTAQILRSLASVGEVTWVASPRNRFGEDGPLQVPDELRATVEPVLIPARTRSPISTLRRWATGNLPWPLAAGNWDDTIAELRRRGGGHDLVWAMGIDALNAADAAGVTAPFTIVDADLESLKLRRQLEWESEGLFRRTRGRIDAARWQRLEQRTASSITTFSLCSQEEVDVLGHEAWVTRNCYARPEIEPGRRPDPDRLLFIGSLGYAPNVDGLRYFVDEVLPLIRADRPEVALTVVGAGLAADDRLHREPGVELVGFVEETAPYLATARAVVVPLRWGAGTRIKILEAFANRVPVVSTTLGAEGLEVEHGRDLLIADRPADLAAACRSLMAEDGLVERLVGNANELFLRSYDEQVVTEQLATRVRSLIETHQ